MIVEFNQAGLEIVLVPETVEEANFIRQDLGYDKGVEYPQFQVKFGKVGKVKTFPIIIIKQY
ncbi:MAG: hypothetical protein Q6361_03895 [Candidatus Hermodarchaeota archaeon]|nr:hypothetical protein [Candidatus Hermodarchaeota archaeon]